MTSGCETAEKMRSYAKASPVSPRGSRMPVTTTSTGVKNADTMPPAEKSDHHIGSLDFATYIFTMIQATTADTNSQPPKNAPAIMWAGTLSSPIRMTMIFGVTPNQVTV